MSWMSGLRDVDEKTHAGMGSRKEGRRGISNVTKSICKIKGIMI
jgi:hypothetical protein